MSLRIKHELWIEQGADEQLFKSKTWLSDLQAQPYSVSQQWCHPGRWPLGQIFDFFKRNSKSQFCLMFVNFKIMATSSNIFNSMQTKKSISLSHIWPMNYFFKVLKKKKNYWNSYFIGIELSWVSEKKCYVDLFVIQWPDSPTFFV